MRQHMPYWQCMLPRHQDDHHANFTKRPNSKFPKYVARGTPHKPKPSFPKSVKENCHKCGRKGSFCQRVMNLTLCRRVVKELQRLQIQSWKKYKFHIHSEFDLDVKNYMTLSGQNISTSNIILIDSASTHTIITNPKFFEFLAGQTTWQHWMIITMPKVGILDSGGPDNHNPTRGILPHMQKNGIRSKHPLQPDQLQRFAGKSNSHIHNVG